MRIVVAPMVFLCGCSQLGSTSGYGGRVCEALRPAAASLATWGTARLWEPEKLMLGFGAKGG